MGPRLLWYFPLSILISTSSSHGSAGCRAPPMGPLQHPVCRPTHTHSTQKHGAWNVLSTQHTPTEQRGTQPHLQGCSFLLDTRVNLEDRTAGMRPGHPGRATSVETRVQRALSSLCFITPLTNLQEPNAEMSKSNPLRPRLPWPRSHL